MKLLLLGATGLVGSKVLEIALASGSVSKVIAPTRTPLSPHPKLINLIAPRLEDSLGKLASLAPDAVICALGTTMAKAGSKEAFRHVDYELPIELGKAARRSGVRTYALVSAMGASADSRGFYLKTKGEVERDIRELGFTSLTICKPGLIGGGRKEHRFAEGVALGALRLFGPFLPKRLRINPASSIAAALLEAVAAAKPGVHIVNSEEMN